MHYSSKEGSGENEIQVPKKKNSIFERTWTQKGFETDPVGSDFKEKMHQAILIREKSSFSSKM